ncbi:MAG: hypothetical protein KF809_15290 [Chloroflexi bacterium]|nr:hypothetical protein [Chloroflexota bacterium]
MAPAPGMRRGAIGGAWHPCGHVARSAARGATSGPWGAAIFGVACRIFGTACGIFGGAEDHPPPWGRPAAVPKIVRIRAAPAGGDVFA